MTKRLLGRNEGRSDDNIDTIKKRFVTFQESSMPVITFYESLGYYIPLHSLPRALPSGSARVSGRASGALLDVPGSAWRSAAYLLTTTPPAPQQPRDAAVAARTRDGALRTACVYLCRMARR